MRRIFGALLFSTAFCVAVAGLVRAQVVNPAPPGGSAVTVSSGTITANLGTLNGAATAAAQANQLTQETASATVAGTTIDAVCATPTSTAACTLDAILKAIANGVTASIPAGTNNIGGVSGANNVTPTNCGSTVVTGNTAVNAFTNSAGKHGFTIANIDTAEVMWISFTTVALAGDTQSFPLAPATATTFAGLSSFTSPMGFGLNTSLSVVAATNGHKFSCTWW